MNMNRDRRTNRCTCPFVEPLFFAAEDHVKLLKRTLSSECNQIFTKRFISIPSIVAIDQRQKLEMFSSIRAFRPKIKHNFYRFSFLLLRFSSFFKLFLSDLMSFLILSSSPLSPPLHLRTFRYKLQCHVRSCHFMSCHVMMS